MRGVETRIQEIRHRIFREVARMAYHTEWLETSVLKSFHIRSFREKLETSVMTYS